MASFLTGVKLPQRAPVVARAGRSQQLVVRATYVTAANVSLRPWGLLFWALSPSLGTEIVHDSARTPASIHLCYFCTRCCLLLSFLLDGGRSNCMLREESGIARFVGGLRSFCLRPPQIELDGMTPFEGAMKSFKRDMMTTGVVNEVGA